LEIKRTPMAALILSVLVGSAAAEAEGATCVRRKKRQCASRPGTASGILV
jgi:hypothetical protein